MLPITFLDHPDFVRVAPVPTLRRVLGGQELDLVCRLKVDHNVGLIIASNALSDGLCRSVTLKRRNSYIFYRVTGSILIKLFLAAICDLFGPLLASNSIRSARETMPRRIISIAESLQTQPSSHHIQPPQDLKDIPQQELTRGTSFTAHSVQECVRHCLH